MVSLLLAVIVVSSILHAFYVQSAFYRRMQNDLFYRQNFSPGKNYTRTKSKINLTLQENGIIIDNYFTAGFPENTYYWLYGPATSLFFSSGAEFSPLE